MCDCTTEKSTGQKKDAISNVPEYLDQFGEKLFRNYYGNENARTIQTVWWGELMGVFSFHNELVSIVNYWLGRLSLCVQMEEPEADRL